MSRPADRIAEVGESGILMRLFNSWISLALELKGDAPDVRGIFIYASSERIGTSGNSFANVYFDVAGTVITPTRLHGLASGHRVAAMQGFLLDDLKAAESEFARSGLRPPTEYRVFYEPSTGGTDVQLARENKYIGNDELSPRHGIRYWLGDRAPKNI